MSEELGFELRPDGTIAAEAPDAYYRVSLTDFTIKKIGFTGSVEEFSLIEFILATANAFTAEYVITSDGVKQSFENNALTGIPMMRIYNADGSYGEFDPALMALVLYDTNNFPTGGTEDF